MADAILSMDGVDNYNELLEKAVFSDESSRQSPAYICSMTKAYLKDGSADHAIKFFQEQIKSRQDDIAQQEEHQVSLFDSTFG